MSGVLLVSAPIHLEFKFGGCYFSAHISEVFLIKVSSSPAIYLRVYGRYQTLIQGFTLQWNSSIFPSESTLTPHPPLLWPEMCQTLQDGFSSVTSCFQCRFYSVQLFEKRREAESGKNTDLYSVQRWRRAVLMCSVLDEQLLYDN